MCGWGKKAVHKFIETVAGLHAERACVNVCVTEPKREKKKKEKRRTCVCLCATPHALIKQHQLGMNEHQ